MYFPAGNYVTGPIELVSNLVLHIDAGATLRFPAARLPFTKGRAQGIECLMPVPLIDGTNVENVAITGRGVITTGQRRVDQAHRRAATTWRLLGRFGRTFGNCWNRRPPSRKRNI